MLKRTAIKKNKVYTLKKSPLKKSSGLKKKYYKIKPREKTDEEKERIKYEKDKINAFWIYVGENTLPYSEISKTRLEPFNKATMHHLYEKNDNAYPELKYSISNILRVTLNEHGNLNNDPEYYDITVRERKYVMDNYEECKKESSEWSETYDKNNKI